MQTRLHFYIHGSENDECYNTKIVEINDDTVIEFGECMLEIPEYTRLRVEIESDDKNAFLRIDGSRSEEPLMITMSDGKVIVCECNPQEEMLPPAKYLLEVSSHGRKYEGLYAIKPSSATNWSALVNLTQYLESIVEGLSQDLYERRRINIEATTGREESSLLSRYEYIENNIDKLIINIKSIINNPLTDLVKEYTEQPQSRRPDIRSIRWLNTKGLVRGGNPYYPSITKEKKALLTQNTIENKWVKKMLLKIIEVIEEKEKRYTAIINNLEKSLLCVENKIEDIESRNKLAKDQRKVVNSYKERLRREIEYKKEEKRKIKERLLIINKRNSNLKKSKLMIVYYCQETWLKDISSIDCGRKIPMMLLKDRRYVNIHEFYRRAVEGTVKSINSKSYNFINKKTSIVFEYYSVIMCIDILRKNGFEWEEGWLASSIAFNQEIPRNEAMIFLNDIGLKCKLTYEKEILEDEVAKTRNVSEFIRRNTTHYKPDILISLFDVSNKLVSAVVIEVKCSTAANIYSKRGSTRAMEQIKDYDAFGYYDHTEERIRDRVKRSVINKVIVVYPKQHNIINSDMLVDVSFVQVEANENEDIGEHFGYETLKKEIEEGLNLKAEYEL